MQTGSPSKHPALSGTPCVPTPRENRSEESGPLELGLQAILKGFYTHVRIYVL